MTNDNESINLRPTPAKDNYFILSYEKAVSLTTEEQAMLRPAYEDYCAWFEKWMIAGYEPLNFDDWWREYGDNLKTNFNQPVSKI